MKKYLILLAVLSPFFWQCTNGPSKEELSKTNDALLIANAQKEIQLNQLVEALGSIEDNLQIIKEKEEIISLKAKTGETRGSAAEQINEDIQLIYDLMLENKNRIQELEKQMKNAGVETGRLKKLIEGLNAQLREKTEEIAMLNELLLTKDVRISEQSYAISTLNTSLDSIQAVSTQTKEELEATKDLFYTAYYAVGTKKELRDRNITDRNGFLFFGNTKVLPEGFDKQYFNKIDARNTETIVLIAKKIKFLTRHPDDSYNISEDKNSGEITIRILNNDQFWSITRYLVVQVN